MSNDRPVRKIRLSAFGKWLLALTIFLFCSAQNTGNNLLYLVCSCLVTAFALGYIELYLDTRNFSAELIYPKIVAVESFAEIICKVLKNKYISRYYLRFDDCFLEKIEKGNDGYFKIAYKLEELGKYTFKNFSIIKPGMLSIYYFQYSFPDFYIYAEKGLENRQSFSNKGLTNSLQDNKYYGGDGDFYAQEIYREGEDCSRINWSVSARSQDEWVINKTRPDNEEFYTEKPSDKISKSVKSEANTFEIIGKNYKDLRKELLSKQISSPCYRFLILLAILACFAIYSTGFEQDLIPWVLLTFFGFAFKGIGLKKEFHKYVYVSCVLVALYILVKNYLPDAPVKIVLLLRFSILILVLQFLTLIDVRNSIGALTLVFMVVLGVAAMNVNFAFPGIFLPFFILASMVLTFYRLNLVAKDKICKNNFTVSPNGMFGTVVLLIIFFLLWIPFFYLIPRSNNSLGIGSEFARNKNNKGFSATTMSLKGSGFLEDNPTVVMRICPNDEKTVSLSILRRLKRKLIRGCAFSEYDDGEWRKSRRGFVLRDLRNSFGEYILDRNFTDYRNLHSFEIILENTDVPTVFVPEQTKQIFFKNYFIGVESDDSIFFMDNRNYHPNNNNTKKYIVSMLVDEPEIIDSNVSELETFIYDKRILPYLSLNGVSDRVMALGNSISAKSDSIVGRCNLIIDYLRKTCNYSLDLEDINEKRNPMDEFIFNGMAGTCQHYATAMVFLLRSMDIPARVVNGYIMGDWNDVGGFFTIRQSHAHAWVEVFLPNMGWTSFNPTPNVDPDYEEEKSNLKQIFEKLVEIYEGYWFNYVYSFDKNAQLFANKKIFFNLFEKIKLTFKSSISKLVLLSFLIAIFLFNNYLKLLWSFCRNKKSWIPFCYRLWETKLPIMRKNDETPMEFHNRLKESGIVSNDGIEILYKVSDLINEISFKSNSNKSELSKQIKNLLKKVEINK